jgi:pimeloyl-ACP methyl ester carboxylesterase
MVGEDAARSILDAVRAAASITDLRLSRETVIWGHSQGGHAALFTGSRALEYAPDVIVRGVVAMAPATDLVELVRRAQSSMFGKIVSSYLVRAYASRFPDVSLDTYITAINRIAVNDIASRCVGGWETLVSLGQTLILPSEGIFATDPTQGRLGARLRENTPLGVIASPVLIAQGDRDDLVFPDLQQSYVLARCATGQAIDYRVYAGRDHISLVNSDSPAVRAAVEWVEDRFQGRPFTANCPGMGGR